jgi:uncharacterized membrane protein
MTAPRHRLAMLDALRGAAVMAMIHQHVSIWLWRGPDPGLDNLDYPALVALNVVVVPGAPLFFALSGIGTTMLARDPDRPGLDAQLVRRGLVLLGFGLLVNLVTPSWFSWGSFFALHLMGLSIALAVVWRRLPDRALLGTAFAILAATPFVQAWLDLPSELSNPEMRDVDRPGGVLALVLGASQYSMLPWSAAFLVGMWAARKIDRGELGSLWRVGAVLVAAGALGHLALVLSHASEPDVLWRAFRLKVGWFPAPLSIVMPLLGLVLWIIALAVRRDLQRPLAHDHALATVGRVSLTVFILHAPLFRELSRPIGLWSALDPVGTLAVVATLTVITLWLARRWSRVDFRWGAEWWLRRLADRPR